MAQINVNPIYLKDCVLSVAGSDFEKAVSSVTFTPAITTATFKGLEPSATYTNVGSAAWTIEIAYAQDWQTEGSLSAYLFEHEGAERTLTFEPVSGGASWSADVIIVPGAVGGAVDSYAVATVSLPVQGKPVFAPAGA
jgi:hypothetical protein